MTDASGKRHTLRLTAPSLFQAALNYKCQVVCSFPGAVGMPTPGRDTILEVQPVGGKVYRVRYGRAMEWANAEAEQRNRGQ